MQTTVRRKPVGHTDRRGAESDECRTRGADRRNGRVFATGSFRFSPVDDGVEHASASRACCDVR